MMGRYYQTSEFNSSQPNAWEAGRTRIADTRNVIAHYS